MLNICKRLGGTAALLLREMEVKDEGVKKVQRKYSVFDGEVLKTELENVGVKTLHVFTIWTFVRSPHFCSTCNSVWDVCFA